jgi:hypothetical protein
MWKKLPDSFFLGVFSGLVSLGLFYTVLAYIRIFLVKQYQDPYMLMAPKPHVFAIFLNILLFRFFLVKTEKEQLGKGILLSTVILSFVYFFFYFKYHRSIVG